MYGVVATSHFGFLRDLLFAPPNSQSCIHITWPLCRNSSACIRHRWVLTCIRWVLRCLCRRVLTSLRCARRALRCLRIRRRRLPLQSRPMEKTGHRSRLHTYRSTRCPRSTWSMQFNISSRNSTAPLSDLLIRSLQSSYCGLWPVLSATLSSMTSMCRTTTNCTSDLK